MLPAVQVQGTQSAQALQQAASSSTGAKARHVPAASLLLLLLLLLYCLAAPHLPLWRVAAGALVYHAPETQQWYKVQALTDPGCGCNELHVCCCVTMQPQQTSQG